MNPVAPEDSVFEVAPRSFWQALRDLAISAIVVTAIALIVSFISAASAHAQGKPKGELRIGYQKSASLFVLQKAQGTLEKNGLKFSDIQPVYLAPADGRAAFESRNVDAWVIWDPFQAAAEKSTGARVLADGAPDVVNNYQFYLGERGFVTKHPLVIEALFEDSVAQGIWLKKNLRQAAELIAPLQGLPVEVVELALRRYEFNVKPITAEVAAEQQKIADAFFDLKLIPKAIKVSDAVVVARP